MSFLHLSFSIAAQPKNEFNYQVQALNNIGNPIVNTAIKVKTSIVNNGITVYSEIRNVTTNQLGLFTIPVGNAGALSNTGIFSAVDWATGTKAIKIEIDPTNNGTNYLTVVNANLTSVPYALYAVNGKVGPQGIAGTQGPMGLQGVQGTTGNTGAQGLQGIVGQQGVVGIIGAQGNIGNTGPQGAAGIAGIAGIQGVTGANGKNTVTKTTAENAGANCVNGGQKMEYGIDVNNNGILDIAEVNTSLTKYICKGNDAMGVNVWSLTGNAGTTASNFIGSTNQPLTLKMNNAAISTTNGFSNWVVGNPINNNPLKDKLLVNKGLSVQNGNINIINTNPSFENLSIGNKGINTSASFLLLNTNKEKVTFGNGSLPATATLTVGRGIGTEGTAKFIGTNFNSHINYSTTEDTYIRGGKPASYTSINSETNGNVTIADPNGQITFASTSNILNGVYAENYDTDLSADSNKINIVPIGIVYIRTGMQHIPGGNPKRVPYIAEVRNIYGDAFDLSTASTQLSWENFGEYDQLQCGVSMKSAALIGYKGAYLDGSVGFYTKGLKVNGKEFGHNNLPENPYYTHGGSASALFRFPKYDVADFDTDMFIEFTVIVYGIKRSVL